MRGSETLELERMERMERMERKERKDSHRLAERRLLA